MNKQSTEEQRTVFFTNEDETHHFNTLFAFVAIKTSAGICGAGASWKKNEIFSVQKLSIHAFEFSNDMIILKPTRATLLQKMYDVVISNASFCTMNIVEYKMSENKEHFQHQNTLPTCCCVKIPVVNSTLRQLNLLDFRVFFFLFIENTLAWLA